MTAKFATDGWQGGHRSLEWTGPPVRYPSTGSDMHWWTWDNDDAIYCVDDDGRNFGGPWNFAHLLGVTGTPPHHKVEEISGLSWPPTA